MTPDTPLEEVAQHLPAEIASLLLKEDPSVQRDALGQIRTAIQIMEHKGARLDPGSYEAVLHAVGMQAYAYATARKRLRDLKFSLEEIVFP